MSTEEPTDRSFGFTVQRKPIRDDSQPSRKIGSGWWVHLPHSCDEWDIAGDEYEGVPREEAVTLLERFIAEAQVALAALRGEREEPIDG